MSEKLLRVRSLTEQVRSQLLWLGLVLFLTCIVLLFFFAWRSIEVTTVSLVKLEARSLIRLTHEDSNFKLPREDNLSAYRSWQEIPEFWRQYFAGVQITENELIEVGTENADGELEYVYLLHHVDDQYGELYVLSRHSYADVDDIAITFFNTAISQALWFTLIIFVILFILIRWLIRRTTEPLSLLSRWAEELGKDPNKPLDINFPIAELNQLALQLREGVDRIHAFNQREQQFLRHASHELRTPLAIIQASLDTLSLQSGEVGQRSVQRALKASANMRSLSTALLWLARESEQVIEKSPVEVRSFCQQIIDDQRYLLNNREADIQLDVGVEVLEIENDLLSIVVSNLVRNAFQHCASGVINIKVSQSGFFISNAVDADSAAETAGFGLGLQLTQRICHKLGWQFEYQQDLDRVNVSVAWGQASSH